MAEIHDIVKKAAHEGETCLSLVSMDLTEPTEIPMEMLLNSQITSLKLDFNDLQCLPEELGVLVNLRMLSASGNQLSKLPDGVSNLHNLEELHLNENNIEELPESLGQLSKLRILNLTGNQLEIWREEFGNGLSSLTELRIDENNLTELPNSFTLMKNLTVLELGDNHIEVLPEEFGNLINLEVLNLSQNEIENLPESFGKLPNLKSLDITGNHIEYLPDVFESARKLQQFYADNNSFTVLPRWFENLESIITICLSDNELGDVALPPNFGSVSGKTLETLDLSGNKITQLPDSIGELVKLKTLQLGSTINELERRAFQNGNWLSRLPETFGLLVNLTKINLDENQVVCLPEEFGSLRSLEWLDVGQNRISQLPESFCNLSKLWFLQLSKNQLTELPEDFGNLTSLVELRLDSNLLTSLPDSVAKLQNVKTLDLFCNELTEIPKVLLKLKNLTRLDLDRNKLKIKADKIPKLTSKVHYAPRDPKLKDNWRGKLREDKEEGDGSSESITELLEHAEEFPDNDIDAEEVDQELVYSEAALERAMRRGLSIWRSHTGPDEREVDSEYSRHLDAPFPNGNFSFTPSQQPSDEIFEDASEEDTQDDVQLKLQSLSVASPHQPAASNDTSGMIACDEDWDVEVEDNTDQYVTHASEIMPATKLTDMPVRNQLQCLISMYPPAAQAFTMSAKYDSAYYADAAAEPGYATPDVMSNEDGGQFDDADD